MITDRIVGPVTQAKVDRTLLPPIRGPRVTAGEKNA